MPGVPAAIVMRSAAAICEVVSKAWVRRVIVVPVGIAAIIVHSTADRQLPSPTT
jgi:hypothetical protein